MVRFLDPEIVEKVDKSFMSTLEEWTTENIEDISIEQARGPAGDVAKTAELYVSLARRVLTLW